MKTKLLAAALTVWFLLCAAGCGGSASPPQEDTLQILATTYPVYLFTTAVTEGVDGVEVSLLVKEEVSCLHDYTLTVNDMKAIEKADVIVLNGAGFESFMDDALSSSDATVIDCSDGISLLPATGHHDHDHGHEAEQEHYDPHIWLDPARAMQMMENIASGMSTAHPGGSQQYSDNLTHISEEYGFALPGKLAALATGHSSLSSVCTTPYLITFHDGFQYFADAFDLTLLKAIEEEEGAEASAAEIKEIVALIKEYDIPAVFVEKNGSDSTAQAIARETGVAVHELDMLMSGDDASLQSYSDTMCTNLQTIAEALK